MDPAIRDRELRLWRRASYRLHVLSWRLAFLAGALTALTQVLRANHVIGHLASVVVVVPLVAVFGGALLLVLVTGAIQAAHISVNLCPAVRCRGTGEAW